MGTFQDYKRTFGQALLSEVQANVFQASTRNYDNVLDWALLTTTFLKKSTELSFKYQRKPTLPPSLLKNKGHLGVEDLRYYDIYPDMLPSDAVFTYQDSIELTIEGTKALGEEYNKKLADYASVDHVHVYPNKGKRSGAYMSEALTAQIHICF